MWEYEFMHTESNGERILGSTLESIGNTPIVRLSRLARSIGSDNEILGKLELLNPGGSVKDRIGLALIETAEREGKLKKGMTIVEPTSGNTGVALSMASAIYGYKMIVTLPDKMSKEKVDLLKAFGTKVVIAPTDVPPDSPEMYINVAKRIADEIGGYTPNQYFNRANPEAHYRTTGPEIWRDCGGRIDFFVAGIGTGGTISGIGRYLKEHAPEVKVVGVDPEGSILKDYFYSRKIIKPHQYLLEGIGEDFVPGALDFQYIDEIVQVSDKESFLMARALARTEGILAGGTSGAALAGAIKFAKEHGLKGKRFVVLFPDSGDRYITKFYSDDWMRERFGPLNDYD